MTPREQGFLLLTSSLGDTKRRPLSVLQFRTLIRRSMELPSMRNASTVTMEDMAAMGYDTKMAQRVVELFAERSRMERYVASARRNGCTPITLADPDYPPLRQLGWNVPGVFWTKGDRGILDKPSVALVGSRDLYPENALFAREVGRLAARCGYVLISGNARGADAIAQAACLAEGGQVIAFVAGSLTEQPSHDSILYIAENSFDLPFTAGRALSRNRFIHCMGQMTFVAQTSMGKGGTWDGAVKNLHNRWSPVYCFRDGSAGMEQLIRQGAHPVTQAELPKLIKYK